MYAVQLSLTGAWPPQHTSEHGDNSLYLQTADFDNIARYAARDEVGAIVLKQTAKSAQGPDSLTSTVSPAAIEASFPTHFELLRGDELIMVNAVRVSWALLSLSVRRKESPTIPPLLLCPQLHCLDATVNRKAFIVTKALELVVHLCHVIWLPRLQQHHIQAHVICTLVMANSRSLLPTTVIVTPDTPLRTYQTRLRNVQSSTSTRGPYRAKNAETSAVAKLFL